MGHTMATWKLLEYMVLELKKAGIIVPPTVIEDLRASKSMIKLACTEGSPGDAIQKAEEYHANVEAYLVNEAQKAFGSDPVDKWLNRLEEASAEVCEESGFEANFVTGVPRHEKWVRIEPIDDLPAERISQLAAEEKLEIKPQKNGKLLVHGPLENIKDFIKKMTFEGAKE